MSSAKDSAWKGILTILVLTVVAAPLAAQTTFTVSDRLTSSQLDDGIDTHIHVVRAGETDIGSVDVFVVGIDQEGETFLGPTDDDGWLDFRVTLRPNSVELEGVQGQTGRIQATDEGRASLTVRVRGRTATFRWRSEDEIKRGFVLDLAAEQANGFAAEGAPSVSDLVAEAPPAFPVNTYIDSALVRTQLRLRFDAAYNNSLPDRAEFFYGQCGCFRGSTPGPGTPPPNATFATEVDYQEFLLYAEHAVTDRLSGFIELPFRMLNPDGQSTIDNTGGLSDVNAGFKFALWDCNGEYLTFQLRVYAPTGDGDRGLGTAHASLEPALLYHRQIGERLSLYGEVRDWIPFSDSEFMGDNFDGNVLRYGAGLGYDLVSSCDWDCNRRKLTPFVEFVGWSILDGLAFDGNTGNVVSVGGDAIVNVKGGMRYSWNEHSVAVSYGRALTDHAWYEDIARVEYRIMF